MAYISLMDYQKIYGEIEVDKFTRYEMLARRKLDNYTTGADGFCKLKHAFPTDEEDAAIVKQCAAAMVNALYMADKLSKAAAPVQTENGVHSNVITSISAGNESVHYAAVALPSGGQESTYSQIVREYLSGACDANGVNLLYMGRYPYAVNLK